MRKIASMLLAAMFALNSTLSFAATSSQNIQNCLSQAGISVQGTNANVEHFVLEQAQE